MNGWALEREEMLDDGRVRLWYRLPGSKVMPVVVNRNVHTPENLGRIGDALLREHHRLLPDLGRVNPGD